MSVFFRRVSETESESESSGDEQIRDSGIQPSAPARGMTNRMIQFSDSEEEAKRIVKPTKDKRYGELKEQIKLIRNLKKIKDMCKILSVFEDMCKLYDKARTVVLKEGAVPRFYTRALVEMEDFVNECWEDREGRKNMSKNNSRGLTTLRQKLRKYIRDFEEEMVAYREEPDAGGYSSDESVQGIEGSESEAESDDDAVNYVKKKDQQVQKPVKKGGSTKKDDEESGASSDSEIDWEMSSDESSESSEDFEGKGAEELRKYFLKKTTGDKDEEKGKEKKKQRERAEKRRLAQLEGGQDDDGGEWEHVERGGRIVPERPKLFEKDTEINYEVVLKKFSEILAQRGKKGTDKREQTELLKELREISNLANLGSPLHVKLTLAIIASLFDYNPKFSDCLSYSIWMSVLEHIQDVIDVLEEHRELLLTDNIMEEEENVIDTEAPKVKGCILVALERLDDEFTKILQNADCHSTDYVEKLRGENHLCRLMEKIENYFHSSPGRTQEEMCRLYIRRIEHIYYKFDINACPREDGVELDIPNDDPNSSICLMQRLCHYIYQFDMSRRLRTRALLAQIYYLALHDRWHSTRDLMLMSRLQSNIDHSDIHTQILYNRAICQLGLCAFRHGLIREAHNALSDIQNGGKARELLAQGLSIRNQDRTAEQEKQERSRQMPYHMHINLELLECVYLITAMLLEIPTMASKEFEVRRRLISRSFHYQLKQSERQSLLGPPENTREHVVAAARALLRGDWKSCKNYIVNDKMNSKVWNLFNRSERVQAMLVSRIQEESLRTYLLSYSSVYQSISLRHLADMFEMEMQRVHALISRMIIQEELFASLDEPNECLVLHRTEPSRLHTLALQLSEKLNGLQDNSEQILDPRFGQSYSFRSGGNWFSQRQGNQQDRHDKDRQGKQTGRQQRQHHDRQLK